MNMFSQFFKEITVENCIAKRFHQILQAQLEPVWHQLSARSKDLVQDLKVMRELIMYVLYN